MATTAKVFLSRKEAYGDDQHSLEFRADYDDGANKEWAKYTPAMSVHMTVLDSVAERFTQGAHYTVTFEENS